VPVVPAQLAEQAPYFVLFRAALAEQGEKIRFLILEMGGKFVRQEGNDGRGLGLLRMAQIGDPVQDGADLAFSQVHGVQIVDRSGKQGPIDRRKPDSAPCLA